MYIGKLLCFRTLPLYNSKLFDLIKVAKKECRARVTIGGHGLLLQISLKIKMFRF